MLKAEHITKRYPIAGNGKQVMEAVADVSVTLAQGRVTAIVGESGSGKSTLARILSYTERADAGSLWLEDLELTSRSPAQLRPYRGTVQLVMQDAASSLDPRQRIRDILQEPMRYLLHMGKDAREETCRDLLSMMQLPEEVLDRRPDELSGGQQKRICIARALAAEPRYILFDESFSGLDVTLKKQILTLLKELQPRLNLGMLIITHDLDTALYMADTIHVMKAGKIIETAEKPFRLASFQHPYSQELVTAILAKRKALQ